MINVIWKDSLLFACNLPLTHEPEVDFSYWISMDGMTADEMG